MNAQNLTAFRQRARLQAEELKPATIAVDGADEGIAATTSGLKHGKGLVPGMFLAEDVITFRVRKELLPGALELVGHRLTWVEEGKVFRIDSVSNKAELFFSLGCNAPSSK